MASETNFLGEELPLDTLNLTESNEGGQSMMMRRTGLMHNPRAYSRFCAGARKLLPSKVPSE